MPVVGLRQLSRDTRAVVGQLEIDGRPVVITDRGKPVATLIAMTEQQAAAYAIAVAPEYAASRERAARAIEEGQGKPAAQVLADLSDREAQRRASHEMGAKDGVPTGHDDAAARTPPALVGVAESLARIDLPSWLVELVATIALADSTSRALNVPALRQINVQLVETLVREALTYIAQRVRTVNESIVAERGDLTLTDYLSALKEVESAERRFIPGLPTPQTVGS